MGDQVAHAFLTRRATSLERAEAYLSTAGFARAGERSWDGRLTIQCEPGGGSTELAVTVELPQEFPDKLPNIRVKAEQLPNLFPHVEDSGKICITPPANVSVDILQPDSVVEAALERAKSIICAGFTDTGRQDVAEEFLAYWKADKEELFWSISASSGPSRPLYAVILEHDAPLNQSRVLIAESRAQATEWTARVGARLTDKTIKSFLINLRESVDPPGFKEVLSLGDWFKRLQQRSAPADWQAFQEWLGRVQLPCLVVFSVPTPRSTVPALAGVYLPRLRRDHSKAVQRGFRPKSVNARIEMTFAGRYPLEKVAPTRLDSEYLRPRGGGLSLNELTVVLVGCGSIGGFLAFNLASLGVGRLRLVDTDEMAAENVHRHLLGVGDVGSRKVVALAKALERHFPHQSVDWRTKRIEELLISESDFLLRADLIIIAIGEETLERHLNEALGTTIPRMHTWLEPLGVGGHVMLTGRPSSRGCYECLFSTGPQNDASLCAPNQEFARTFAGCAGVYSPFSSLDATRTALEAARVATSALLGEESANVLLTWRGEPGEFERDGYSLSDRGQRLLPGSVNRQTHFARADCPICQAWA